jgi:hypothetical protein
LELYSLQYLFLRCLLALGARDYVLGLGKLSLDMLSAADWTAQELGFDSRQVQEILLFSIQTVFEATQPHRCVPRGSSGVKRRKE